MKKAFVFIALCSAMLAFTCHPAKASPEKETVITTCTFNDMVVAVATPFTFNVASVAVAVPVFEFMVPGGETVEKATQSNLEKPLLDGRIRLHKHYYNHEDNKEYPEYKPGNLSIGFTLPVFRPALT